MEDARARRTDDYSRAVGEVRPAVVAAAYAIVGVRHVAEDVAQDAMVVGLHKLDDLRSTTCLDVRRWLCEISRRLALNVVRRRTEALIGELVDRACWDASPSPLDVLCAAEDRRLAFEAVEAWLDAEEREVVRLRYDEGRSISEIDCILGLTNKSGARGVLQRVRRNVLRHATSPDDLSSLPRRCDGPRNT